VKRLILMGAESTGKTTLAHMLVGRLRSRGVDAELVAEPGASLPFHPALFDANPTTHLYCAHRLAMAWAEAELRAPPQRVLVCDREPVDFLFYARVKHPAWAMTPPARALLESFSMMDLLDATTGIGTMRFHLPIDGSVYVEDGRRATVAENTWRVPFARFIEERAEMTRATMVPKGAPPRERAAFVWAHVVDVYFGESRPSKALAAVRAWLTAYSYPVVSVSLQGSNSPQRFHVPTDHDDVDLLVVVRGDAALAAQLRDEWLAAHRAAAEESVQASLDVSFVPEENLPYDL
jgi:hypothetical protein